MKNNTGQPQNNFTMRAEDPWLETLDDTVALCRLGSRATAIDKALELFRALRGLPPMPHRVGTGTTPPSYRWKKSDMLQLLNNAEATKAMYQ